MDVAYGPENTVMSSKVKIPTVQNVFIALYVFYMSIFVYFFGVRAVF